MFAAISPCTLRLCLFEPVVESIWHLLLYSHFRRQIFVADAISNSVFLFSFRNPPTIGRTEALQENSSPMARRSRWRQWQPRRQKRQWSWSRGLQQRNFGWVSGKPNGIEVWCKKPSIKSYSCPTNVYIYNYIWLYIYSGNMWKLCLGVILLYLIVYDIYIVYMHNICYIYLHACIFLCVFLFRERYLQVISWSSRCTIDTL